MSTLEWKDVLAIGRGLWDDVTRCRMAEREWAVALAVHPRFQGPQSVIVCGDSLDAYVESAFWTGAMETRSWCLLDEGAWVTRGPLTVWRRPLAGHDARRLFARLLELRVSAMKDLGRTDALFVRVYFRQGDWDHEFLVGHAWRDPEHRAYRELLRLFFPYLKPSLQLYFQD